MNRPRRALLAMLAGLFFMTDAALKHLQDSDGRAIGSGPSVVVVDKGAAASMTSTTLSQDVYAFPFGQHGLMAGLVSRVPRLRVFIRGHDTPMLSTIIVHAA